MSTAIDMYLNQISLTGGIPFAVTLPKAPDVINADLMTDEQIHEKLQKGSIFEKITFYWKDYYYFIYGILYGI